MAFYSSCNITRCASGGKIQTRHGSISKMWLKGMIHGPLTKDSVVHSLLSVFAGNTSDSSEKLLKKSLFVGFSCRSYDLIYLGWRAFSSIFLKSSSHVAHVQSGQELLFWTVYYLPLLWAGSPESHSFAASYPSTLNSLWETLRGLMCS